MNLLLSQRSNALEERMDDPNCDQSQLNQTYRRFSDVNRQLSQWNRLYQQYILPRLKHQTELHILDLGCGGGDVARHLITLANQDGFAPKITGADPDPRAIAYAQDQPQIADLHFISASSQDLLEQSATYDIVISNHVMHHLNEQELSKFAEHARQLSTDLILFNDILRHDMAYALFHLYTLGRFSGSFIKEDGLTSIKRSFTVPELKQILNSRWDVFALFPFRVIARFEHANPAVR